MGCQNRRSQILCDITRTVSKLVLSFSYVSVRRHGLTASGPVRDDGSHVGLFIVTSHCRGNNRIVILRHYAILERMHVRVRVGVRSI